MAVLTSDAEIRAAIARGQGEAVPKRAMSVTYLDALDALVINVEGRSKPLTLPRSLMQGLENATAEQVREIEYIGGGEALRWPRLDADHLVASLAQGILNTEFWRQQQVSLWRKAGQSRSEAKRAAARANGPKGGRPRKQGSVTAVHTAE